MPLESALAWHRRGWLARVPAQWRAPLVRLVLAWAGLIALFFGEWADMAAQWWNSSTYNHVLLVPAILAWLVKLRARELAEFRPQAWWPGLILLAGALLVWMLGAISGLNIASQLGAVLMLQTSLLALLGPRIAAALLFPLAYMLFLVPFGDSLVPTLQLVTADLTIALTQWSGVPAHIEGVFIDTPAGLFEVAEACSGVKFLIAMIALGTLVAHLCFASWKRRAAFMAAAVVLPILANGVRAWGTIYIAQSQGVEFAAGFDHIFYGWIFFALVMAALIGAGWRFFDRPGDDTFVDREAIAGSRLLARVDGGKIDGWLGLGIAALLALGAFSWVSHANAIEAQLPSEVALPSVEGWTASEPAETVAWEPRAGGADRRLLGQYRDAEGRRVDVFYALYSAQTEERDAGAAGEGALVPGSAWRWSAPGEGLAGGAADWLRANGSVHRLAVTWYRTGELTTASNSRLKLANMADRLLLADRPTAMLIVSAEAAPGNDPQDAISRFLAATGPIGPWMDGIAGLP